MGCGGQGAQHGLVFRASDFRGPVLTPEEHWTPGSDEHWDLQLRYACRLRIKRVLARAVGPKVAR